MNILIVCSANSKDFVFEIHRAFISDQINAIRSSDDNLKLEVFLIRGKGVWGYLKNLPDLRRKVKTGNYDLIHAHYSLSGLLANLQRRVPVVTTYHGSDINLRAIRIISAIVSILSKANIYVSEKLSKKAIFPQRDKDLIIPCGVDLGIFKPEDKLSARSKLGLEIDKKYILFSSGFDNKVKNYPLLTESIHRHMDIEIEVLELRGYQRFEVARLMNAVDVCALTSFSEGSPQFIKEAMACNCPIVSTDVGDVKKILGNTPGCFLTSFETLDVAEKIQSGLEFHRKTDGRAEIVRMGLDSATIAGKIVKLYQETIRS